MSTQEKENARKSLKGARVDDLLEFSRKLHAEMAALTCATHRGVAVAGSSMYVTTFPCHLCAKHIMAAGIEKVVYMEPYAKSVVKQLYKDAVTIGGSAVSCDGVLQFRPFVGVAPRQYLEMFAMSSN